MSSLLAWYGIWTGLLLVFLLVLRSSRDRRFPLLHFGFGCVFGFYFDATSVALGYYTYADLGLMVAGVPLSMTLAEGFAVAITARLYAFLSSGRGQGRKHKKM